MPPHDISDFNTAMKIALEQLGYGNVYHMSSIFDDESHARLWTEIMEARYDSQGNWGDSTQLTAGYWDTILGNYNVCNAISLLDHDSWGTFS